MKSKNRNIYNFGENANSLNEIWKVLNITWSRIWSFLWCSLKTKWGWPWTPWSVLPGQGPRWREQTSWWVWADSAATLGQNGRCVAWGPSTSITFCWRDKLGLRLERRQMVKAGKHDLRVHLYLLPGKGASLEDDPDHRECLKLWEKKK